MFSKLSQPRTYVKLVGRTAYSIALTTASTAAISAVVEPETESAQDNVELAGLVVGTVIWWKTAGVVNVAVDKVADWHLARKEAKKTVEAVA